MTGILAVQQHAITVIRKRVGLFLKDSDQNRGVVEVSLPTGWGKTRAVLRAILDACDGVQKKSKPKVVIWPKSEDLLKHTWRKCANWCPKNDIGKCLEKTGDGMPYSRKCIKLLDPKVVKSAKAAKHVEIEDCIRPKLKKRPSLGSRAPIVYHVNNNNWHKIGNGGRLGTKGEIIIVVDEWHRTLKRVYMRWQKNITKHKKNENEPDNFREYLLNEKMLVKKGNPLGDSARKILWILVSATPCNPVREELMEIGCEQDETDKKWEALVSAEVAHWRELVKSLGGNDISAKEILDEKLHYGWLFPEKDKTALKLLDDMLKKEQQRLTNASKQYSEVSKIVGLKWKDACTEYAGVSRALYENKGWRLKNPAEVYLIENLALGGYWARNQKNPKNYNCSKKYRNACAEYYSKTTPFKLRALKGLLEKTLNAPQARKVVVFCCQIGTALAVAEYLNATLFKGKNRAKYITTTKMIEDEFENKRFATKGSTDVLVVTDKYSEGIDLHSQHANLVHYELPWNPIRVMQRFGRVWRIGANGQMNLPKVFHIVHTFSAEEEKLNRLERRWTFLEEHNLTYLPFSLVLGNRVTPILGESKNIKGSPIKGYLSRQ